MEFGTVGGEGDEEFLAGRISFPATTMRILEVPLPSGAAYLVISPAMYGEAQGARNQCGVQCPNPDPDSDELIGAASCDYLRPQWKCRMRGLSSPFCRACASKLRDTIQAAVAP